MGKYTLLELHFDGDAQFGPTSDGSAETRSDEADVPANRDTERMSKGSTGKTALKVSAALGVVVGGAVLVRRLVGRLSGDSIPSVELEREELEPTAE